MKDLYTSFKRRVNANPLLLFLLLVSMLLAATTTGDLALYQPADNETGWGTNVNNNFQTIDTAVTALRNGAPKAEVAFADGDTTPSVAASQLFRTANTGATSITNFDDPTAGQEIELRFNDANTTVVHGTNTIRTVTGANIKFAAGDIARFRYDGTDWFQLSGGYGGGGSSLVGTNYAALSDEPVDTDITAKEMNLNTDGAGIPLSAKAVLLNINRSCTGTPQAVRVKCRPDASVDDQNYYSVYTLQGNNTEGANIVVNLDGTTAQIDCWYGNDPCVGAAGTYDWRAVGYWQ